MDLAILPMNGLSKDFSAMSHDTRRFKERRILIKMTESTNCRNISIYYGIFESIAETEAED
jgi:hypothetical protein